MFTMQIFSRYGDDYGSENVDGMWATANDAYQAYEQRHAESYPPVKGMHYLELYHNGNRIFNAAFTEVLNKGELLIALENCGALTSDFGKFFNRMLEAQNVA